MNLFHGPEQTIRRSVCASPCLSVTLLLLIEDVKPEFDLFGQRRFDRIDETLFFCPGWRQAWRRPALLHQVQMNLVQGVRIFEMRNADDGLSRRVVKDPD